jgi:Rv0078B-related antitoxin
MTPEAARELQIKRYQAMTDEQRVKFELDLYECACNVARAGIRHQFPTASDEEVEEHLRRRIDLGSK